MSRTRSGLFVFVIATSATACRNDNQPTDLEPPAPATKTVEEPAVEASDTADTSGSTGGATIDPETYRMPITISSQTYLLATGVAVASALVTALLVRRRLDSLDLVAVLKSHT